MTLLDGWTQTVDYDTLTFRPDLAELFPWEVVCKGCNLTHFFRLPACPDLDCPSNKEIE